MASSKQQKGFEANLREGNQLAPNDTDSASAAFSAPRVRSAFALCAERSRPSGSNPFLSALGGATHDRTAAANEPSPYGEDAMATIGDEMVVPRAETEAPISGVATSNAGENDAASMKSISLSDEDEDEDEDESSDADWDDVFSDDTNPDEHRVCPRIVRLRRAQTITAGTQTNHEPDDSAMHFDDFNAIFVPDEVSSDEGAGEDEDYVHDYTVVQGPRVHEVYAHERDRNPTLQHRVRRRVTDRFNAALATGRGLASNAADRAANSTTNLAVNASVAGRNVGAELRRTGQDIAVRVEETWPEVRRAFGRFRPGLLTRTGELVREVVAALPPMEYQTAMARGRRP